MSEQGVTAADETAEGNALPAARRRRWPWWAALALVVVAAVGVTYAVTRPSGSATFTVRGTLVGSSGQDLLAEMSSQPTAGSPCTSSEIDDASQVVVYDAAGKQMAIGTLAAGVYRASPDGMPPVCAFAFTVTGVPGGRGPYAISIGEHSKVAFNQADAGDLALNLG